jgi:hypothetical protein
MNVGAVHEPPNKPGKIMEIKSNYSYEETKKIINEHYKKNAFMFFSGELVNGAGWYLQFHKGETIKVYEFRKEAYAVCDDPNRRKELESLLTKPNPQKITLQGTEYHLPEGWDLGVGNSAKGWILYIVWPKVLELARRVTYANPHDFYEDFNKLFKLKYGKNTDVKKPKISEEEIQEEMTAITDPLDEFSFGDICIETFKRFAKKHKRLRWWTNFY